MKPLKHIFAFAPDAHTPGSHYQLLWRRNIYEGIRPYVESLVTPEGLDYTWARRGHDTEPAALERDRTRASEQLWARIRAAHAGPGLDAVVSYCFAQDVALEVVKDTLKMGVPWINFFCDSTHMFERVEALARVVSLNWFPESAAEARYRALGVPSLCAPYAFSPQALPDLTLRDPARAVAFIGLPTANRITQLGWLRLRGCAVEVRGHGWVGGERTPFYSPTPARRRLVQALFKANLGEKICRRLLWPMVKPLARGPLSEGEFDDYVRGTAVVLGLNQANDAQGRLASYLKFRDVEFPGYGCCYLTEHHDDIPRVFEVGKEILTFGSVGEAARLIRRFGREPRLAREIGRAARRRVLSEHNWGVRLRQFQEKLSA